MEATIYAKMDRLEHEHWWFVSRRNIIRTVLRSQLGAIDPHAKILDAGCGTGGNLDFLSSLGCEVTGLEMEQDAAEIARLKSGKSIYIGSLPDHLPFPDESFDLIVLLDVLEHIDDDHAALASLTAKLKAGGHLLITVPAFAFLWSHHDESHHHKRRYRLQEITSAMKQCSLQPKYASYFNTWLFPVIAIVRMMQKIFRMSNRSDDLSMPSPLLNRLLTGIMSSERHILMRSSMPFGVSIVAIGQKV
jgi:SAM-dependent methyltransferase